MAARPGPDFELTFGERRPHVIEHHLSASRPFVVLSCLYQQGARCDQPEHVFQVSKRENAGHAEVEDALSISEQAEL